uniref:Uncharacterized protein n=1 Tax=Arundo donax TaxID=35708 RepID=A0A0A9AUM3_ARUDO
MLLITGMHTYVYMHRFSGVSVYTCLEVLGFWWVRAWLAV